MVPPKINIGPVQLHHPHQRLLDDQRTPIEYAELDGGSLQLLLGNVLEAEVEALIKYGVVCLFSHF